MYMYIIICTNKRCYVMLCYVKLFIDHLNVSYAFENK